MEKRFAVYRDFFQKSYILIHLTNCPKYDLQKLNKTTRWYLTHSYNDAKKIAQNFSIEDDIKYTDCEICRPVGV